MKRLTCGAIVLMFLATAQAEMVFNQPHNASGTLYQSSWWDPDDSDYDQYVWDNFTVTTNQAISEIGWRGGFIHGGAYGGPVINFTVAIYPSIAGNSEPDVAHQPLVEYEVGGNANQTFAGTFGGVAMYDYRFALPAAFQAAGGVRYWLHIFAWQHGIPEWGFAGASGGDGQHFRFVRGLHMYQRISGDAAYSLYTSGSPTITITATASPADGGTILGAGNYPPGSPVSLVATPNTGFGFVNWTETGVEVSRSRSYSFTATGNRTLVANFIPAYSVMTSASPSFGGTTIGDGIFNSGAPVTVTASAISPYVFVNWTEFGAEVSISPAYSFVATANRTLVANFAPDPLSAAFDFDDAPVHTSLPIDLTVSDLTAHLSATGYGFSIQPANTMGFTPGGFAGNCIYPNSVFAADLLIGFSSPLSFFSIMYSPQELACDSSARMRVTAYHNGAAVGTNTAIAPVPGTWPTGTLNINVATGFDSVVVHYDARPPTCQDWGPIFLADNMVVTRTCNQISIEQPPTSMGTCASGVASFIVVAGGCPPVSYRWQAELDPGAWTDLADGNLMHGATSLAFVNGAATDVLELSSLNAFVFDRTALNLRVQVTNAQSNATSIPATLTVWPTATGDINQDGRTDGDDIGAFVASLFNGGLPDAGSCACDFNGDAVVDGNDLAGFSAALIAP